MQPVPSSAASSFASVQARASQNITPVDQVDKSLLPPISQLIASYLPWEDLFTQLTRENISLNDSPAFLQRYFANNHKNVTELTFKTTLFENPRKIALLLSKAADFFPNLVLRVIAQPLPQCAIVKQPCSFENQAIQTMKRDLFLALHQQYQNDKTNIQVRYNYQMPCQASLEGVFFDVIVVNPKRASWPWPDCNGVATCKISYAPDELALAVHTGEQNFRDIVARLPAHKCSPTPAIEELHEPHMVMDTTH